MDTICAIGTAPGGAIGIVRVSGPDAVGITSRIFTPAAEGKKLEDAKPYTLTFGQIREGDTVVDEVLVSLFRAPHSYTGEDSTEISCHGSQYILRKVLQLLIANGCRMAQPGEYTQRAFLNGKMDLSQAEAVADLIASSSAATHRLAMNQMRGGFSRELASLREQLLHFTSLIELELDFSDHEELEFADRTELCRLADRIEQTIARLVQSFSLGNALKNGVPVAIIGETNVGKSTLLNALLNEERAIVSDIHGTTRDVIEDTVNIGGVTFRFIDTAGIRDTTDRVESLGIERTFQKLDQADIVLWLVDATQAEQQFSRLSEQILPRCKGKRLILILNKADLLNSVGTHPHNARRDALWSVLKVGQKDRMLLNSNGSYNPSLRTHQGASLQVDSSISLSAKNGTGITELQQILVEAANLPTATDNDIIVTNVRHYEALTHALESIHRVQQGLKENLSGDFLAQDIRECIYHLSDIVGEVTTDMVLHNIFKTFCIGK